MIKHWCCPRSWWTKEYRAWTQMHRRCYNKSYHSQHRYASRNIGVYSEWCGENWFAEFHKYVWDAPGKEYSLDRIDNNKSYEPWNVRWATKKEQSINSSRPKIYKGRSMADRAKYFWVGNGIIHRNAKKYWYEAYIEWLIQSINLQWNNLFTS